MPTTPGMALPYPPPASTPDVPYDLQKLAEGIETALAFKAYAPTINGVNLTSSAARRQVVGGRCNFEVSGIVSSVTGNITIGLPPGVSSIVYPAGIHVLGVATVRDISAGAYVQGVLIHRPGAASAINSLELFVPASATNSNQVAANATTPFTWAAGDQLTAQGSYAVAP